MTGILAVSTDDLGPFAEASAMIQELYSLYNTTTARIIDFAKQTEVGVTLQPCYDNMKCNDNLMTFVNSCELWISNQSKRIKLEHNKNSRAVTHLDAILTEFKKLSSSLKTDLGFLDIHYLYGILIQNNGLLLVDPFCDNEGNVHCCQKFFEIYNAKFLSFAYMVSHLFLLFVSIN